MINKETIRDVIYVIAGNFILSVGVALFIVPNSILTGGAAGIAVALSPIIPISTTMLLNILTVILFVFGACALGKMFAFKTLISTVLYPVFVSLLTPVASHIVLTSDPILASIYGGACMGIGVGLVFKTGASTGGMDIPPLVIHKYFRHTPLATLVLLVDAFTVLLGMSIHGIEPALVGLISVWICSYMINKTMMFGLSESKSLMIISDLYDEIFTKISSDIDRSATIIEAEGGYTKAKKPILMVVISKKQFPEVNRIIQHIDPSAFVIIHDVNEVQGEGFTFSE